MEASIVVPVYQKIEVLEYFLDSLKRTIEPKTQAIFVNDGSGALVSQALEATAATLRTERDCIVEIIEHKIPQGCGQSLNDGLAHATGDVVIFADSDTILAPGWQQSIVGAATTRSPSTGSEAGMAGSVLLYPQSGGIQHAGLRFSNNGGRHWRLNARPEDLGSESFEVQVAAFALFAATREVLNVVQGLDENYFNGYEDFDFQMRARQAGFRTMVDPSVQSYHWELSNGPHRVSNRKTNLARFWSLWGHQIEDDLTQSVVTELGSALDDSKARVIVDLVESRADAVEASRELHNVRSADSFQWVGSSHRIDDGFPLVLAMAVPQQLARTGEPLILFVENFVRTLDNEMWMRERLALGADDIIVDLYGNRLNSSSLIGSQWPGRKVR